DRPDDRIRLVEFDVLARSGLTAQVRTGTERPVIAGEDEGPGVRGRLGDGLADGPERRLVERVEGLGAIDGDGRDIATDFGENAGGQCDSFVRFRCCFRRRRTSPDFHGSPWLL